MARARRFYTRVHSLIHSRLSPQYSPRSIKKRRTHDERTPLHSAPPRLQIIPIVSIHSSGELARSKVLEQHRHAQEVGHLDLALGRWLKGRRAARDGYALDEGGGSGTNYCCATTPSSVVGLVRIKEPNCGDARGGGEMALLEVSYPQFFFFFFQHALYI